MSLLFLVKRALVLFLALAAPLAAVSRQAAERDFRTLNAIFTRAHAVAFDQIPLGNPPDLFADLNEVDARDFVKRIVKYYKMLKVDHTGLGFSPELIAELKLKRSVFPFPLKFFSGRAYFDCETGEIPFGSELISVANQTIPDLLARITEFARLKTADGKWNDARLTENFPFLLYLVSGPPADINFEIQFPGETLKRKLSLTLERAEKIQSIPRRSQLARQLNHPAYSAFYPQLKTAYLALNTFMPTDGLFDSSESWNNYLNFFHNEARLRKSENLIIDLRQNRGGVMIFSAVAAQWFIGAPFSDESQSRTHTRLLPYSEYIVAINGQDATPTQLKEIEQNLQSTYANTQEKGYFALQKKDARFLKLVPVPQAHRFKRIYLLTGSQTYSAAVNFARTVKLGGTAVVILGTETGSPGDGHTADFLLNYKLPNTKLLFEIPVVKVDFIPSVPGQLAGQALKPDILVEESLQDFLVSRDPVLDRVLKLIATP